VTTIAWDQEQGIEPGNGEFGTRADGFTAYFNLLSRLSAVEYRELAVYLRRPLSWSTGLQIGPGSVVLICTIIGPTTVDGLSLDARALLLAFDLAGTGDGLPDLRPAR
jgi:hypothetical protein